MTPERALEIVTAYGADSARWPEGERAAVLAMAGDGDVAAAIAAAQRLDAALGDWAAADVSAKFDFAAMSAGPQEPGAEIASPVRPPARPLRWITGGAMAAAVTGMLVLASPLHKSQLSPQVDTNIATVSSVPSATAIGTVPSSDAQAFASVFTPTVDEEELI